MAPRTGEDASDLTLRTYEAAAQTYVARSRVESPARDAFLARVAALVAGGDVLELGSGPGWDADFLEAAGARVQRTDGALAFVDMLRAAGHDVRHLDLRAGDYGGPYAAVVAMASLLHLSRADFARALVTARRAVGERGLLAFTVKEGDGERWSEAKLELPRHFTYWREAGVRELLERAAWDVVSVEHVQGREEGWLFVIATAGPQATP